MSRTAHLGHFRRRQQRLRPDVGHGVAQQVPRAGESEARDHVRLMGFYGLDADAQALGDDAVGESVRDTLEHLTLALGKAAGAAGGTAADGAGATLPAIEGLT